MLPRSVLLMSLLLSTTLLGGCLTTSENKPRPGVAEAKACQRALERNRSVLPGFVISSCTNTGVWVAEKLDENGEWIARYDFLNGDYAGPETGFGAVAVESLGETQIQSFYALRKTLNRDLKDTI
jgi:hypothetical protein